MFLFSTIEANASIHYCNGEVTEIAFMDKADCEHKSDSKSDHCKMKCCKSEKKQEKNKKDDCCDTEELIDLQDFNSQSFLQIATLVPIFLPDFTAFLLEEDVNSPILKNAYLPSIHEREILIEIQCFRI